VPAIGHVARRRRRRAERHVEIGVELRDLEHARPHRPDGVDELRDVERRARDLPPKPSGSMRSVPSTPRRPSPTSTPSFTATPRASVRRAHFASSVTPSVERGFGEQRPRVGGRTDLATLQLQGAGGSSSVAERARGLARGGRLRGLAAAITGS
jgi:hypothetical protein